MSWRSQPGKALGRCVFVMLLAFAGCDSGQPPPPPAQTHGEPSSTAGTTPAQPAQTESSLPGGESGVSNANHGVVLTNKELGMAVSGQGAGTPGRTVDVLERQVVTLLPDLREAYEHERAQEPALMGSLDVSMTVEPGGAVSDLRFPIKRVSSERLTATVFDQMRGWMFPSAELPVQLRFTLLFIPPGMDEASILLWEKRLGSRPVIEKVGETPEPTVVASAQPPGKKKAEEAPEKRSLDSPRSPAAKSPAAGRPPVPPAPSRPNKKDASPVELTGWYRVLYPTVLRDHPQTSAAVVTRLRKGVRVNVVNVIKGQWLEVRSIADRPSGFLWWEDAVPEQAEQAERRP